MYSNLSGVNSPLATGCPRISRPGGACCVDSDYCTADLRTEILGFRGFHSSIIFRLRGGILMYIGIFPGSLSQAILAGRFLVGRLGVQCSNRAPTSAISTRGSKHKRLSGHGQARLQVSNSKHASFGKFPVQNTRGFRSQFDGRSPHPLPFSFWHDQLRFECAYWRLRYTKPRR